MSKTSKSLSALRERSVDELKKQVDERRRELFDLRMSAYTDQERSPSLIRNMRREVARMLTVIQEKESEATGAEATSAEAASAS